MLSMLIPSRKMKTKIYQRYSGFFGGRKVRTLGEVVAKRGFGIVLRKAIYGMLPGNRLRAVRMRRLRVYE